MHVQGQCVCFRECGGAARGVDLVEKQKGKIQGRGAVIAGVRGREVTGWNANLR